MNSVRVSRLVGIPILVFMCAVQAFGARAKGIKRPMPGETVQVLVQYATQPTEGQHGRVDHFNGRRRATFEHVPVAHYEVTPEALADLESNPDVVSISPNQPVRAFIDRVTASSNYWPLNSYYMSQGRGKARGIGVAILDSGINPANPNFNLWHTGNSRIVYSESFVGGDTNDQFGHGTHVAGIAVGTDNVTTQINGSLRGFGGLAPDANIINLKVLDATGRGTDASVIAGINRAIALKNTYNIRVMNLSLGRPVTTSYKTDPLCQAVEAAWQAGIVVVVAAGNDGRNNSLGTNGYGTITAPGNDPYVITVGASNDNGDYNRANDVLTTFSSKGPTAIDHIVKPDLLAPGNQVVAEQSPNSALVSQYPSNQISTNTYNPKGSSAYSPYFFTLSGTSMAAPVVSGAAAMLIDKNSAITPDQVKAKLMRNAWRGFPTTMSIPVTDPTTGFTTVYTESADLFSIGAGLVDIWAAYNDTAMPSGSAASPVAVFDPNTKTVQLQLNSVGASTLVWGTTAPFATSLVWGTNVQGTSLVWGTTLVWGTSLVWGTTLVWGTDTPGAEFVSIAINGDR